MNDPTNPVSSEGSAPIELTDLEAIELAKAGNSEVFQVLYERYVTRIYNYVYYRTGVHFEAEDLTAKVFFKAFGHIGRYQNLGLPFSAWLYRIAHNLVANWHRDNSRRKEVPLDDHTNSIPAFDMPESSIVKGQEIEDLLRAIRRLSPERQNILVLKFVEQLTNAEIAVIMGRSEGAVKSLYHRTLLSVKDELIRIDQKGGLDVSNSD